MSKIISKRLFLNKGYIYIKEMWSNFGGPPLPMNSAYSWPDLYYIGTNKTAYRLNRKFGITEFYPTHDYNPVRTFSVDEQAKKLLLEELYLDLKTSPCCLIGFNKEEQTWYGWARDIHGFTIGSKVKKGDIGYLPDNKKNFIDDTLSFWSFNPDGSDKRKYNKDDNVIGRKLIKLEVDCKSADYHDPNQLGVYMEYITYVKDDRKEIVFNNFNPYPDAWGKGEWTAETMEDAKQMAIDFAQGCS